jgi:hypothetical protein
MMRSAAAVVCLLVSVVLLARGWGWSSWWRYHRHRAGNHDDVACARCAHLLTGRKRHTDAEYAAGVADGFSPAEVERWNRSWDVCYVVFPQYPWRVTPWTNGHHDLRDDLEAWIEEP